MERINSLVIFWRLVSTITVGLAIILAAGCAGNPPLPPGGEVKVADDTVACPDWRVTTPNGDSEFLYFVGFGEAPVMSQALVQARADGQKRVLEQLQARGYRLLVSATVYSGFDVPREDLSRAFRDGLSLMSRSLFRELQEVQRCWAKVRLQRYAGVSYRYDAAVLLKMPRSRFNESLEGSVDLMRQRAKKRQDEQAEKFADELQHHLENWLKEEQGMFKDKTLPERQL